MEPLSMAALGVGALSAGLDIFGGFGKADRIRAETAEMVRRFTMKSEKTISEAGALGGGASGVTSDSGSLTKTLSDMTAEFRRQADWMRQAGEAGASASEMSGLFSGLGDLGGSVFKFGAANNWFREPSVR